MKKIFILTSAITLMAASLTQAQQLSLEECIHIALENNIRIHTADYNLQVAHEISQGAFTKYFPSVSISGAAFTANHGMLQHKFQIPLSMLNPEIPDMDFNMSLLKKGSVAGINLIQPIFLGGRLINANRLAHLGENVNRLQQRQSEDEVRRDVEQYYWQLVSLHSKHKTLEKVISMLDTLSFQVKNYVDAGITTSNDLLEVNLKRNEMLVARTELDNGIAVIRMLLSQYLGKGTSGSVDVSTDLEIGKLPDFPYQLYCEPEACLDRTVGHGLLVQNVKAKELEQKIALGNNLPTIAAGASYNYEHLLDQSHTFANVYVTVSIPLTDWWGGSHDIKKKKIETQIARDQMEDNSQLLIIAMKNAWNDLNSAYKQMEIACESINQSAENLRMNQNFYEAGTITVTDLLNAQTLYRQAQDKFIDAYGQFQIKKLSYLQATGR